MIEEIPEEIINFEIPDYELEGSEVLEMIKDMPERPIFIEKRKLSSREISYEKFRKRRYPDRIVPPIGKEVIKILYLAVQELNKVFQKSKGDYSIINYSVWLIIHLDYDIVSVGFLPNLIPDLEGSYFEVPCQGKWQNGPGVNLHYSLSRYKLLRKYYMR